MSHNNSHKSGFKTLVEVLAVLAVLGVAAKKAMEWLKQWEASATEQGLATDMMKLMNEKFKTASKQFNAQPSRRPKSAPVRSAAAKPVAKKVAPKPPVEPLNLNTRQEKIYTLMRQRGDLNMQAVTRQFTNVSPRTLRRDMTQLESLGLISQSGRTKNSTYKLANS